MTSAVVFALDGAGLIDRVVTEGQLSGLVNKGLVVGEASPEAADGGPLALLDSGDMISLDVAKREVNLEVAQEELAKRNTGPNLRRAACARLSRHLPAAGAAGAQGRDAHMKTLTEERRETKVYGEFDVVVVGGGPAGIAAAVAAGRSGRSTLLIERYGFLGGAGTAAGLSTFCGLHANVHGEHKRVIRGICDDVLEGLRAWTRCARPIFRCRSASRRRLTTSRPTRSWPTGCCSGQTSSRCSMPWPGASMASGNRIDAVIVETKSGRRAVRGRIFIDCSGDGDLAAWAGAPSSSATAGATCSIPSTMYRICGVDPEKAGEAWERIPELMEKAERSGRRFRAGSRSCARSPTRSSGAPTLRRSGTPTAAR